MPIDENTRIGEQETATAVLQTGFATLEKKLDQFLSATIDAQNKTADKVEALRIAAWPPFLYVLTVAAVGATLMAAIIEGNRYIIRNEIASATALDHYKIEQLLAHVKVTYEFTGGAAPR